MYMYLLSFPIFFSWKQQKAWDSFLRQCFPLFGKLCFTLQKLTRSRDCISAPAKCSGDFVNAPSRTKPYEDLFMVPSNSNGTVESERNSNGTVESECSDQASKAEKESGMAKAESRENENTGNKEEEEADNEKTGNKEEARGENESEMAQEDTENAGNENSDTEEENEDTVNTRNDDNEDVQIVENECERKQSKAGNADGNVSVAKLCHLCDSKWRNSLGRSQLVAIPAILLAALLPTMVTSMKNCEIKENTITVNSTQHCIFNTESISTLDSLLVEGHLLVTGANRNLQVNSFSVSGSIQAQGTERKDELKADYAYKRTFCLLQRIHSTPSGSENSN